MRKTHFAFSLNVRFMIGVVIEMENTMRISFIPISLNLILNGSNSLTHEELSYIFTCTKVYF